MKKVIIFVLALLFLSMVSADVVYPFTPYSPSYETSSFHLDLKYEGSNITETTYLAVLMCYEEPIPFSKNELNLEVFDSEKNCYWTSSYRQYETCESSDCNFLFRYPKEQEPEARLIVFIPSLNKSFVSNNFILYNTNPFEINILSNETIEMNELVIDYVLIDEEVDTDSYFFKTIVLPFLLTLAIESLVALFFLRFRKIKKKIRIILFILLANLISWPLMFIIFLYFLLFFDWYAIIIAEGFAIVFEGFFIHWTNKKTLNLKSSFLLSLLMNILSVVIGMGMLFLIG